MGNGSSLTLSHEDAITVVASTDKLLHRRFCVSDKVIGSGRFATVTVGYDLWNHKPVAVRVVPTAGVCAQSLHYVRRGTSIHALLDHPHIVNCLYCSEDEYHITTVEELVKDGSLLDYYARISKKTKKKKKPCLLLQESTILNISRQLLSALAYLFQKGIVHRDLKLDNVLYDASSKCIKLADFGFAECISGEKPLLTSFPGSLAYSPPEVVLGRPHEGPPRDMWSLGVMLYAMFTGSLPFGVLNNDETRTRIIAQEPSYGSPFFKGSNAAKQFVQRLLNKEASTRMTILEAMVHPWITGATRPGTPAIPLSQERPTQSRGIPAAALPVVKSMTASGAKQHCTLAAAGA